MIAGGRVTLAIGGIRKPVFSLDCHRCECWLLTCVSLRWNLPQSANGIECAFPEGQGTKCLLMRPCLFVRLTLVMVLSPVGCSVEILTYLLYFQSLITRDWSIFSLPSRCLLVAMLYFWAEITGSTSRLPVFQVRWRQVRLFFSWNGICWYSPSVSYGFGSQEQLLFVLTFCVWW